LLNLLLVLGNFYNTAVQTAPTHCLCKKACHYIPAKFKLLFATLLLWIIACFHILIINFSIQHCPFFKCNVVQTCYILIQCSMCLNGVKCDTLETQSNIVVCIPNQYPYFAFRSAFFCVIRRWTVMENIWQRILYLFQYMEHFCWDRLLMWINWENMIFVYSITFQKISE